MAISGVHICFGFCNVGLVNGLSQSTLPGAATSSQTMANAGTSTVAAAQSNAGAGPPMVSISASAAIFYATGPIPDASGASYPRRYYDPSFGREDIFVNPGDKFAWVLA